MLTRVLFIVETCALHSLGMFSLSVILGCGTPAEECAIVHLRAGQGRSEIERVILGLEVRGPAYLLSAHSILPFTRGNGCRSWIQLDTSRQV